MASDEDLMAAIAQGDDAALAALMERWQRRLLAFLARAGGAHSMDAADLEDIAQETWIRVVRGARGFDVERRFSTWFFQIARNLRHDALARRPSPATTTPPPQSSATQGATQGTTQTAGAQDTTIATAHRLDVAALLDCLGEDQRAVVELRYLEDRSVDEVGAILEIPAGTVKSRLWHALRRLADVACVSRPTPRSRR